ncbi:hypothetical protein [Nocardia sp. MW-W600-9]
MNAVAHIIQCAIVGGTLLAVLYFFYALVRADLRANPPMAVVACDGEDEDGDDPGADWDRGHDQWVDREIGAA